MFIALTSASLFFWIKQDVEWPARKDARVSFALD